MTLRTFAILAAMVAVPAAATAQDHKCGCCANKHGSHQEHGSTPPPASAPAGPHDHDATPGPAADYDAAREGLFAGIVYSVMRHPGMDVQLTVGAGEATFEVLVAPIEWLDRKNVVFRSGERVEILGSRQDVSAPNTIVAREIRSSGQTVVLRDHDGKALWQ
jgi:hypothetical protein